MDSGEHLRVRIADARDRLYRVALAWCGDEMLADDLVQETLTVGILNCHQLRDESRLFSWLYTILHHRWHRYLRSVKPSSQLSDELSDGEVGPLQDCQGMELIERVRRAVSRLALDQRQVVALVDLDGLSYCEVAAILDIPIGTVMSRLHRARKNLLALLDGRPNMQAENVHRLRRVK